MCFEMGTVCMFLMAYQAAFLMVSSLCFMDMACWWAAHLYHETAYKLAFHFIALNELGF